MMLDVYSLRSRYLLAVARDVCSLTLTMFAHFVRDICVLTLAMFVLTPQANDGRSPNDA